MLQKATDDTDFPFWSSIYVQAEHLVIYMYYTLTNPTSSKTFLLLLIQKVIKKRLYYYNLLYINNLQFFDTLNIELYYLAMIAYLSNKFTNIQISAVAHQTNETVITLYIEFVYILLCKSFLHCCFSPRI